MRVLAILLKKDPFQKFAVQELISLLKMFGVYHDDIFNYEKQNFKKEERLLDKDDFIYYPFVLLDIKKEDFQYLNQICKRSINIDRFVYLFEQGNDFKDLNKKLPQNKDIDLEIESNKSFCFKVMTHQNKLKGVEKIQMMESLNIKQFKGKCDLKNKERLFMLCVLYDMKLNMVQVFFGKDFVLNSKENYNNFFNLKNRPFLGPTTTDSNLAFMMCNQGQVKENSLVMDPFFGTGSIIISASYFKGICFGAEIDIRVLQGYGVGNLNKKSSYAKEIEKNKQRIDAFLNFNIYKLNKPELIRIDSVSSQFQNNFLDCIICDPPYGIRAGIREQGTDNKKVLIKKENTIIQTKKTTKELINLKLINFARKFLKSKGKLVFLYPETKNLNLIEKFDKIEGFNLLSISENNLTKIFSRYLITMEKLQLILNE